MCLRDFTVDDDDDDAVPRFTFMYTHGTTLVTPCARSRPQWTTAAAGPSCSRGWEPFLCFLFSSVNGMYGVRKWNYIIRQPIGALWPLIEKGAVNWLRGIMRCISTIAACHT